MALTRITKGVIKPNENYDTHNINSTGIVTAIGLDVNGNGDISGNLSVGGVITYEDVTSIDSVGIITAQKDIHVGAGVSAVGVGTFGSLDIGGDIDVDGHTNLDNVSVAGVTTHNEDVWFKGATSNRDAYWDKSANTLYFKDNARIYLGDSSDFRMYHTPNSGAYGGANILGANGHPINLMTSMNGAGENGIIINPNADVILYYDNAVKLRTSQKGIQVGTGVTIETNGQSNFSGISTFHTGIYIKEANNYGTVQNGAPNLDLPFVLDVRGGGSTGIGTALFTGGYGTRPEVVFEQRHGGNFVNSYPHSYPWKIRWTLPNDNDTTDDQVLIQNSIGVGGNFTSFQVKTTDNSTGLRNTLDLSSTSSTLYVDNNVALRVNSDGVNIPNWLAHHGDSTTKIGFSQNGKVQIQASGTTRFQTTSIGAQIDTVLLCYGAAGNPGRLRLQEGGALSEIMVARNSDNNSFLYFKTEISGSTDTRVVIDESGHFRPFVDSTYDLGISGTRWRRVYADNFYGDGSNLTGIVGVPSGCIILWSGAANAIPSGFVLCNGSNSTPDLRGKFVVGYHNSNGDYDVGDTGGAETVTLSEAQMPSHNHTFSSSHTHGAGSYTTNTTGNHSHTWQRQDVGINNGYRPWPASNNDCKSTNVSTSNAGNHSHSISGTSGSGTASGTTGNKGSGNAHENRPPYYALCYIMKT